MTRLTAHNISAGYGAKTVISDINLTPQTGQLIALIGPNGSGKSTLIKSLAGLLPISSGEIELDGEPLESFEPRLRAKKLAYMAQARIAMPSMTVREILELGRAPYRGRLGDISADGQAAIDRAAEMTRLEDMLTRRFGELSGGEQCRVLLGRALTVDAPILLADEPIAALDPYYQILMMEILKTEAKAGKTVIAALHDLSLANHYADQVWVMHNGKLFASDTPERAMTMDNIRTVFKVEMPFDGFSVPRIETK